MPRDQDAFQKLAHEVATGLREGQLILVYCAAGRGRTGMLATAVQVAPGLPLKETLGRVREAGSGPESEEQDAMLKENELYLHAAAAG